MAQTTASSGQHEKVAARSDARDESLLTPQHAPSETSWDQTLDDFDPHFEPTLDMEEMDDMDAGTAFCGGMEMGKGGGTIMYMDGFRWTLASDANTPCLNFLLPHWTLDSSRKFVGALFATVALSIWIEGVACFRLKARRAMRPSPAKRAVLCLFHGFQALMGYLVMMLTMTFSIELFLAVALGLGIGYTLFFGAQDTDGAHVTTNPCCAFMTEEAQENQSSPDANASSALLPNGATTAETRTEDSLVGNEA